MADLESDRGTSITEVLVVLAISALLIVPLFAILRTTNRFDNSQSSHIDARAELDWALTLIANDIRSGTPSPRPRVGNAMPTTLPLSLIDDTGAELLVHWRVGSSGLERITYDPSDLGELDRSIIIPAVMPDDTAPPFAYRDKDGDQLDPATIGADAVVECTTLIIVTLAAETSDEPVTSALSVAIRTRSPGAGGC